MRSDAGDSSNIVLYCRSGEDLSTERRVIK